MWYAVITEDTENSLEKRLRVREAHLNRLQQLAADGRLLVAGPHPAIDSEDPGEAGFTGSLIVADFPSLDEATAWAKADPYMDAGATAKVTVKPFKRVLP